MPHKTTETTAKGPDCVDSLAHAHDCTLPAYDEFMAIRTDERASKPTLAMNEVRIQVLPPLVVNQIAAGEVVERPASVVKELIDNAVDANARRIEVELESGGIELIRVGDDGCGMSREELPLCLTPHATSKVRSTDDLDRIATMGFRGEAMASIASVSRMRIRSRLSSSTEAWEIECIGDEIKQPRPASGALGTVTTVRNLFFNTPARRKFLRTPATERQRCVETIKRLAMAQPAIAWKIVCDGNVLWETAGSQSLKERVAAVVGKDVEQGWFTVEADAFDDTRGMALWGMVGSPEYARVGTKRQWVYLNGRPIIDRSIQHAVKEAFRGMIEPKLHPVCVLMLEMDPGAVDVNVHPRKAEVRFRDGSLVHRVVYAAVKKGLESLGVDQLTPVSGIGEVGFRFEHVSGTAGSTAPEPDSVQSLMDDVVTSVRSLRADQTDVSRVRQVVEDATRRVERERERLLAERAQIESERRSLDAVRLGTEHLRASRNVDASGQAAMEAPVPHQTVQEDSRSGAGVLRVHNSFLVTQDEQGLMILDQHALHERLLYERFMARITSSPESDDASAGMESQAFLTPVVIEVGPAGIAVLKGLSEVLLQVGIIWNELSTSAVAIQGFPTLLLDRDVDPGTFLESLVEGMSAAHDRPGTTPHGVDGLLKEVVEMMACKAAVKAGDGLSPDEVGELLRDRERLAASARCPHGRPTAIRLTIEELERQFGR